MSEKASKHLFGEIKLGYRSINGPFKKDLSWSKNKWTASEVHKLQSLKSPPTLKDAVRLSKGAKAHAAEVSKEGMGKGYDRTFEREELSGVVAKAKAAWKGAQELKKSGMTKKSDVEKFVQTKGKHSVQKTDAQSKTAKVSKGDKGSKDSKGSKGDSDGRWVTIMGRAQFIPS